MPVPPTLPKGFILAPDDSVLHALDFKSQTVTLKGKVGKKTRYYTTPMDEVSQ